MSHLTGCLQLFPGVGKNKAKDLNAKGIYNWSSLLQFAKKIQIEALDFGLPNIEILEERLIELETNFKTKNFSFFTKELGHLEYWRLWEEFSDRFCFLDIETTGISESSYTTVASIYKNKTIQTFERGKNLEFLCEEIDPNDLLVTYNGKRFDIPFLEREFKFKFVNPHLDLMNLLHSIGIKGGLKGSEIQLGLKRPDHLTGMEGKHAPMLWFEYQNNHNREALETLIAYNREDTINLELVLEKTILRLNPNLF
ncbi:ribonuclease H-like domain-containing protein [Leptospira sp. 96542]|nr:ribonuclease H-like domain-containing protein [Leptospira sp. 96542]